MSSVYLCRPTNSTFFTTCCDVAVTDDENECPICKEDLPEGHRAKWSIAYGREKRAKLKHKPKGVNDE